MLELDRIQGYVPTSDEILECLSISSPKECRTAVLTRCKEIYQDALSKNKIDNFNTEYNFILCPSSSFFKVFVDMGYGNQALVISDDYGQEKPYFLIFEDKLPPEYYKLAAYHESIEYKLVSYGMDQRKAHLVASLSELNMAKTLNIGDQYLEFIKSNYPEKFQELIDVEDILQEMV